MQESSIESFSIHDNSTTGVFDKSVSSESLTLGPRTAGDGTDDEESLTGTVISGDCIWQENCEDDAHTYKFSVSEKNMEKRKIFAETFAEQEKKDETIMTKEDSVKVKFKFITYY